MSIIKKHLNRIYGDYLYYHYKRLYEKDPRLAAESMYKKIYGNNAVLNIVEPKSLIEKITWLELNSDTSLWTLCADKYRMREYVAQCGLEQYLPKLYGHWDNPEDIDFSSLPNEFVLKANNGCGTVKIVRNKSLLNKKKVKEELKSWLKRKFGYMGAQKHYLFIEPCVLAEELLSQDEEQKVFSPESMVDYKVWCINGEPESVFLAYNRHDVNRINIALFDCKWNATPQFLRSNKNDVYNPTDSIPKPGCLDEMMEMARKMAKPFPEVRVDFYVVKGKPVIGELTFSTGYGYFTDEYYNYLGSKIDLSTVK